MLEEPAGFSEDWLIFMMLVLLLMIKSWLGIDEGFPEGGCILLVSLSSLLEESCLLTTADDAFFYYSVDWLAFITTLPLFEF